MLLKGFCWNISCLNCGIWDTATFRKHSYLRVIGARRRYLKSTLDLQKLNLTRMSIRMEKWKSSLSLECLASRHSGQNFSADPASAQLQPRPSLRRDCSILNFPVFSHLPLWLWVQNERGKRAEISRCQWNSSANTIQSAPPPACWWTWPLAETPPRSYLSLRKVTTWSQGWHLSEGTRPSQPSAFPHEGARRASEKRRRLPCWAQKRWLGSAGI